MKINLPVSGQERPFAADATLVSRTDTKGIITYANDDFVAVSGYTRKELIGANHNIIRHPDVPPVIFEVMWQTLKSGKPWHGVVKNRCKNGDHYWVEARVVPVIKSGEIIGYMSVRTQPSREQIAVAERAYQAAAAAPDATRRQADAGWKRHFSIRNGVILGIVFVTLLMVAGGILGIGGLTRSNVAMRALFYEAFGPVQSIGRINFLMADNRAQVALALHHNPAAHAPSEFDHEVTAHMALLDANKAEIDRLWDGYFQRVREPAERDLAERYWQSRNRYVQEGLFQAKAALLGGDFARAESLLLNNVNPLYDDANRNVGVLLRHLSARAEADFSRVEDRNLKISIVAIGGISLGSLIMILAGMYFFRATVSPLQRAVVSLERIAEGYLSETVDNVAYGEPGRVTAAVTVMQIHLRVMIDEIRQSAMSIHEQCHHLNQTMMNIAEHADEQHDRIHPALDALQDAGGVLQALAGQADALADEVPAAAPVERARELAEALRVQAFAVEDVVGQLRQVTELNVDNREAVQGAWAASQHLERTAQELDRLVGYFE